MAPYHPTAGDVLIGIAASGTTPYVIGGLRAARRHGLLTGSITCNPASPVAAEAEYALEAVVGPEFVTGSTRMKAGTAQKLMLNMLSTAVMIRLGRVEGNRMVNMQLTNDKLVARGTRMVAEASGLDETEARKLLLRWGSLKRALENRQNEYTLRRTNRFRPPSLPPAEPSTSMAPLRPPSGRETTHAPGS